MATIGNPAIIAEILETGSFRGDPIPAFVFMYRSTRAPFQIRFAVFYSEEDCDAYTSPYISHPVCLWNQDGITPAGEEWLEEHQGN